MTGERIGIYPGTFDPITNGHVDIISRAAMIVDQLIVGIAASPTKAPLFSLEERISMANGDVVGIANTGGSIEVTPFDNLLVDFANQSNATVLIRGLRAVSDFEYEFQMAGMNARIAPDIETVFLMASDRNHFISSRFVKEIGAHGGDISHFVSPNVAAILKKRFSGGKADGKD